jgi:hypothetical protein
MNSLHPFAGTPSCPAPAIGLTVKLDRDIDRQRPCHNNLAVIHAGKPPHAGELRCATCGAHPGWASRTMLDFINETARRFGAPAQLLIWRQQQETPMAFDVAAGQGGGTAP